MMSFWFFTYLTHFSVAFHIETGHLICSANQMTGFYMKRSAGLKWVKGLHGGDQNIIHHLLKTSRFHFIVIL